MKFSSSSLRPVGRLATMRAATMALVVSAFLLGALLGGGMRQTAWAQSETPTPTFTFTATFTPVASTATPSPSSTTEPTVTASPTVTAMPAGRNLTPVIGTVTPQLPTTGGEPDKIDPSECKAGYAVTMGKLGKDIVIYFQCQDGKDAGKAD